MDRQPRERICTEQIDDNEVPCVRSTHGIIGLHEARMSNVMWLSTGPPEPAIEKQIDHLANGEYSRFSPQNRVNVDFA